MITATNPRAKIVLVTATRVAISPDILNGAKYLSSLGHRVVVLAPEDAPLPEYWFPEPGIEMRKFRLAAGGGGLRNRVRRIGGFAAWVVAEALGAQPDLLIGYDPDGLTAATLAAQALGGRRVVYHSLELYSFVGLRRPGQWVKKGVEVAFQHAACATVVHDDRREQVLRKTNRVPAHHPVLRVPNSPLAAGALRRQPVARSAQSPRTVLYHGGLGPMNLVETIIEAVADWPASWRLVMHGWGPADYVERLRALAARFGPDRIRISSDFMKYEDLDHLTASADVGVALYENTGNPNVFEMASGKIFQYLKCGLPVVTVDFPNLRRLIQDTGAGLVVPVGTVAELNGALHRLLDEVETLESYSARAHRLFAEELCYERLGGQWNRVVWASPSI